MKYRVYTIFDEKSHMFGNPLLFATDEEAKRYFAFLVNEDKNRLVCKDLVLYYQGTFDNTTGCMVLEEIPFSVLRGSEVLMDKVGE